VQSRFGLLIYALPGDDLFRCIYQHYVCTKTLRANCNIEYSGDNLV
jgi:hypothetical protein